MSEINDQVLFSLVKRGDLNAFEKLFKAYYPAIKKFALSIVRDLTIAEEIAQEVFMYIWEKREQIELHSSLKSYLFSSAKNKCINYIKLELPKQQALSDIDDISEQETFMSVADDSELLKRKIQFAIDQLPEKCRNIFVLSRYGGLTYNEIAEDLEISVKTVENQMSIALKKLKEALSDDLKNYRIK